MSDRPFSGIGDLFGGGEADPRILAELRRIRNAAELSAALDAHAFFKSQGQKNATVKLGEVIQKCTTKLCNKK